METPEFQRVGPFEAWNAAACRGRVRWSDGETDEALAQLGPEGAGARTLQRALDQARDYLGLSLDGVLCLVSVAELEGRIAWIYESVPAVGLEHYAGVDAEQLLSAKQSAVVVAQVAHTLHAMGRLGQRHPGPSLRDVLLLNDGTVRLTGFSSPFPPPPSYRAPEGQRAQESAVVYRLGVLLATLLSGNAPPPPSGESAHNALVRRVIIRATARPGPPLPERYADWLRGMLSWDPGRRPPLSAVHDRLSLLAEGIPGPSLYEAADGLNRRVLRVLERRTPSPAMRRPDDSPPVLGALGGQVAGDLGEEEEDLMTEVANRDLPGNVVASLSVPPARPRRRRPGPTLSSSELPVAGRITAVDDDLLNEPDTGVDDAPVHLLPPPEDPPTASPLDVDEEEFLDDDPTQEASGLELDLELAPPPRRSRTAPSPRGMPIGVGPPAEAVPVRASSVPLELVALAEDESPMPAPEHCTVRQAAMPAVLWVAWAGLVGLLLVLAILLAGYLIWPPRTTSTVPEQRSVAEALGEAPAPAPAPDNGSE